MHQTDWRVRNEYWRVRNEFISNVLKKRKTDKCGELMRIFTANKDILY